MTRQWRRLAMLVAVLVLVAVVATAPGRPGLGAEQAHRVRDPRRPRRGRGPDGAPHHVASSEKHRLSPQPIIAVNKSGGAGAEGFIHVKGKKGDAHTVVITLSNLFTTPLHTGVPFNWKDLTPVARMALDQFILWVNTDRPDKMNFKSAKEYIAVVKEHSGGATG